MVDRLIVSKAKQQDGARELSNKRALEIGVIGVRSQLFCGICWFL